MRQSKFIQYMVLLSGGGIMSNYVIGSFKRFDKYPIIKLHNNGLEFNEENLKKCPQILVSINTDDQNVFDNGIMRGKNF